MGVDMEIGARNSTQSGYLRPTARFFVALLMAGLWPGVGEYKTGPSGNKPGHSVALRAPGRPLGRLKFVEHRGIAMQSHPNVIRGPWPRLARSVISSSPRDRFVRRLTRTVHHQGLAWPQAREVAENVIDRIITDIRAEGAHS